jgi:hypothetical protein
MSEFPTDLPPADRWELFGIALFAVAVALLAAFVLYVAATIPSGAGPL